nr:hypothetical protein [Yoonia sp.]
MLSLMWLWMASDTVIAEVRVSKETKKGEARFVQTQPNANESIKALA